MLESVVIGKAGIAVSPTNALHPFFGHVVEQALCDPLALDSLLSISPDTLLSLYANSRLRPRTAPRQYSS